MPYVGIDAKNDIRLNATSDLDLTSDSTTIKFGADDDVTLTHVHNTGLTLNSTNKIMFNDASQFIQGSSATVLSLGATDEIDLTATAIDMNGNADVSGTLATGGNITINTGTSGLPAINLSHSNANADNFQITAGTPGVANSGFSIRDVDASANRLVIDASGNTTFSGSVTANAGVVVDNITIDGTEIDLSSGDFTLDVAGNITLDADDGGHVRFKDGGAEYLSIYEDANNNPIIQASIADTNILFKGTDTGAGVITALDLDIANSGFATFNASAFFNENSNDTDFRIKSTGTTNMFYVDASTNRIGIGTDTPNSLVEISDGTQNLRIAPESGQVLLMARNASAYIEMEFIANTFEFRGYGDNSGNLAAKIDTNGNFMVGRSSLGISNTGHTLAAAGYVEFTRDGAAALNVGRNSSAGATAVFWKDGNEAGTIGSAGGSANEIFIHAEAGKAILINNNGLLAGTSSGGGSDNTTDLGQSDVRWKDAHFAGVVDCAEITYDKANSSAGNSGLNVSAQYSYDDNNTNTIGSNFHNNHTFIYINTNAGFTVVPVLSNGGAGIAWANYLWDPDNQTWTSANDMTFTQSGTSGNTFRIQISAGQGTGTIQRTSGSMAYQVYISRPAGGS